MVSSVRDRGVRVAHNQTSVDVIGRDVKGQLPNVQMFGPDAAHDIFLCRAR